jgi:hypothetical protein
VADPSWTDPLDISFAATTGGRWNPPGSFGVLYLNASIETARANVERLFVGLPYGPEDLDPSAAPILLDLNLSVEGYVDALTDTGLTRLRLPSTYPYDSTGRVVEPGVCQPIGQAAFDDAEPGIACRSAAPSAAGEELAWFALSARDLPSLAQTRSFDEWYWAGAA